MVTVYKLSNKWCTGVGEKKTGSRVNIKKKKMLPSEQQPSVIFQIGPNEAVGFSLALK